jgi:hypothetical protein
MLTKYALERLRRKAYGTNHSNSQLDSILEQHNGKDLIAHKINLFLML